MAKMRMLIWMFLDKTLYKSLSKLVVGINQASSRLARPTLSDNPNRCLVQTEVERHIAKSKFLQQG